MGKWLFSILIVTSMLLIGSGCMSLEKFDGEWEGEIKQSRLVRRGLDFCSVMNLNIIKMDSSSFEGSFSVSQKVDAVSCSGDVTDDGTFLTLPIENIPIFIDSQFVNDSFSAITFGSGPLFTHLAHAEIPTESGKENVVMFLTYYSSLRVEVRLISKSIYAIFSLESKK
jgi:hypothetical protein